MENYGNISYCIAEKEHGFSNKPKTLYIEINEKDYEENSFSAITLWLYKNAKAYKTAYQCEKYNFDDFDVVIDVIKE